MYDAPAREAKEILSRLIAADTSNPPGNEARAVDLGAKAPVLLIAHTDVVGAQGQAWTSDPHKLTETGGYWVGRGVLRRRHPGPASRQFGLRRGLLRRK